MSLKVGVLNLYLVYRFYRLELCRVRLKLDSNFRARIHQPYSNMVHLCTFPLLEYINRYFWTRETMRLIWIVFYGEHVDPKGEKGKSHVLR